MVVVDSLSEASQGFQVVHEVLGLTRHERFSFESPPPPPKSQDEPKSTLVQPALTMVVCQPEVKEMGVDTPSTTKSRLSLSARKSSSQGASASGLCRGKDVGDRSSSVQARVPPKSDVGTGGLISVKDVTRPAAPSLKRSIPTTSANPVVIPDGSGEVSGGDDGRDEFEDDSELLEFIASKKSRSTWSKTNREVERFQRFLADQHNEYRVLTDIPVKTLDIYVGEWLLSLKKPDGSDYEPDSITSFHRSIDRHLRSKGYAFSLVKSTEFDTSKQVLNAKRKELTSLGKGNHPNRAEPLSEKDEELLWSSGQLGLGSPQSLFNTVWYHMTKLFGFRGGHESRQLKWGDVELKRDEHGDEYLEFNERMSKTRQGSGSHARPFAPKAFANKQDLNKCPIRAYKLYKVHRPNNYKTPDSPFFVAVNNTWQYGTQRQWYKNSPMGQKLLSGVMKTMAHKAGLGDKRVSNHSVRKTMCTTLLQKNVPPTIIAQLSGHKNVASLSNYAVASGDQQKAMCAILQGRGTRSRPTSSAVSTAPPLPLECDTTSTPHPTHPALSDSSSPFPDLDLHDVDLDSSTDFVSSYSNSQAFTVTRTPSATVTTAVAKSATSVKKPDTTAPEPSTENMAHLAQTLSSGVLQESHFAHCTVNFNFHIHK